MQQIAVHLYRAIGAGLAIGLMEVLARYADEPLSRVPFVTSIVLVMALPDAPPSRPYAVIGGHLLSCLAGLIALWAFGTGEAACAVALGLALWLMLCFDALHPPAGIDAFLVVVFALPVSWVLSPVLIGAIFLVGFARAWTQGERWLRQNAFVGKIGSHRFFQWEPPKIDSAMLVRRALGQRRREEEEIQEQDPDDTPLKRE